MADSSENDRNDEARAKLHTAPPDARFPNDNQTFYCFTMYVDYHRCTQLLSDGPEPCEYFQKIFKSICPNEWISRWDQQREDGIFPATFPNDKDFNKQC